MVEEYGLAGEGRAWNHYNSSGVRPDEFFSFQDGGVGELEVHHEVAEGTVDVAAVALRRRVARRVDHVDAHALRVDDVVGLVQRPDLRVPRDHRVLPQVRARRLDPASGETLLPSLPAIQVSILSP